MMGPRWLRVLILIIGVVIVAAMLSMKISGQIPVGAWGYQIYLCMGSIFIVIGVASLMRRERS